MSPRDKQGEVAQAIESGQLWRAKEILSGRVGTCAFDAELYEQFGTLLLRMGDDIQAGRFLFLSGKRLPDYQPAIDLFLRKHRGGRGEMFAAFPAHVRRRPWVELPAQVQQELEALKFGRPSGDGALWANLRFPKDESSSPVGCLLALMVVTGFVVLLTLFIVYFFYR